MIAGYFIFLCVFGLVLFTSAAYKHTCSNRSHEPMRNTFSISVIIPFRNEIDNLPHLIECIHQQEEFPLEILFIDDHSSDSGINLLIDTFVNNDRVRVLKLPANLEGKKASVRLGVEQARGSHCLTLDADVHFHSTFFNALNNSRCSDMKISPVIMASETFLGRIFGFEYMFFNALNFSLSGLYVSSASGANLLFNREKYIIWDSSDTHNYLASGDDHFLLRDFQANRASIDVTNSIELAVTTPSVNTWKGYFNQRVRWLSKLKSKSNWKEWILGLVLSLYFIGSFILFVQLSITGNLVGVMTLFGIRLAIDWFAFSNYASRLHLLKMIKVYPIFFVVYPVLFLLVIILSLFHIPKWKGRDVLKNK